MTILVCGLAVLDLIFSVDTMPTEPDKYRADDLRIVGGGCAANAAVAIARLGGRATLVAALGDDLIGDLIIGGLETEGVDCRLVQRFPGRQSPLSSVLVDRSGERLVVSYRNRDVSEDLGWVPHVGDGVEAVLVDTRTPVAAAAALGVARRLGVPGVVDAERPIPSGVVEAASHVAFSHSGLCDLTNVDRVEDALSAAARRLPGWVGVTLGGEGTLVLDGGAPRRIPAPAVEVVDTLGAGDVWHGAFVLALAEGRPEDDAVRFANVAAALKCTGRGGRAATPNRAEVDARLACR